MARNRAMTKRQIEWAYTKWCEGYTITQIANALYVSNRTVSRMFEGRPRIRPILKYEEEKEDATETPCIYKRSCGFEYCNLTECHYYEAKTNEKGWE